MLRRNEPSKSNFNLRNGSQRSPLPTEVAIEKKQLMTQNFQTTDERMSELQNRKCACSPYLQFCL